MNERITIMIPTKTLMKLRKIQGDMIKNSKENVSMSFVITMAINYGVIKLKESVREK